MEVGMEPLIRSCDACRDLVDEAKDFLLLPERRAFMAGEVCGEVSPTAVRLYSHLQVLACVHDAG